MSNFWNNSYLPFGQNFNNSQISVKKNYCCGGSKQVYNGKKKLNAIKDFNCNFGTTSPLYFYFLV